MVFQQSNCIHLFSSSTSFSTSNHHKTKTLGFRLCIRYRLNYTYVAKIKFVLRRKHYRQINQLKF